MQEEKQNGYYQNILLFVLSLSVVYFATFANIDKKASEKIDYSFNQAINVFATAKALNAVISLVQGTEVGPPGVTITVGEILDPINDLVERFSWVMLASLASLGIQKILLNIVTCKGFDVLLILSLIVSNIIFLYRYEKYKNIRKYVFKFTILLLFVRFSMPLMAVVNDFVYNNFVQGQYSVTKAEKEIDVTTEKIGNFDDSKSSFFSIGYYKKKMIEFEKLASDASDNIVNLIIIFIFQTMFFPLVFIFLLYKIFGMIFR